MNAQAKKFVENHKKEIKTVCVTAVVVGVTSYIVYKTKTSNMIQYDVLNAVIAEELDYARENFPDILLNKEMYLKITKA